MQQGWLEYSAFHRIFIRDIAPHDMLVCEQLHKGVWAIIQRVGRASQNTLRFTELSEEK